MNYNIQHILSIEINLKESKGGTWEGLQGGKRRWK